MWNLFIDKKKKVSVQSRREDVDPGEEEEEQRNKRNKRTNRGGRGETEEEVKI